MPNVSALHIVFSSPWNLLSIVKSALGILIGGGLLFVFYMAYQQDPTFADGGSLVLLAFGGALVAYGILRPVIYKKCFLTIENDRINARWKVAQEWQRQRVSLGWFIAGLLNPQYKWIRLHSNEILGVEVGVAALRVTHVTPHYDEVTTEIPLAGVGYNERQALKQSVARFVQQIDGAAGGSITSASTADAGRGGHASHQQP